MDKRWTGLMMVAAVAIGSTQGCRCGRDVNAVDDAVLDPPPLAEVDQAAPRPAIHFSPHLRSKDASLNQFIEQSLTICSTGDYDGFRSLFGMAYSPTPQDTFERLWHNVQDLTVLGMYQGRVDPPEYYLHVSVRLRQQDRKGREKGEVVVAIFREAGQWRLGPASKEIAAQVLRVSTRPASRPTSEPADGVTEK